MGSSLPVRSLIPKFEPYLWRPCGVTWDVVPKQSSLSRGNKAAANLRLNYLLNTLLTAGHTLFNENTLHENAIWPWSSGIA